MKLVPSARIRAPELTCSGWAGGDRHLLGGMRGRVVLLDFFSFADPAGVQALPRVSDLAERYRDAGLSVIGVHVPAYDFERPEEVAREEMWRLGIPYPVALDQGLDLFRAYPGHDLPARFLVDGNGFVRGWHYGDGSVSAVERAVRALLREARPGCALPPGPGDESALLWMASPEILFGTRGAGFGSPEAGPEPAVDGELREFPELPELRAQGAAYLRGRWRLGADRIVSEEDEGTLAIVFEGASVRVVAAPALPDGEEPAAVELTLDGDPLAAEVAGADVETVDGRSILQLRRGRLYEWVSSAVHGLHNLEARVRGRGVALHLLHFGSAVVPEEA
jgi:hypothetical protein